MGRPREYDRRVSTALRLPTALHDQLKRAALEREVSVNLLVERAIEEYLDRLLSVRAILATRESLGDYGWRAVADGMEQT